MKETKFVSRSNPFYQNMILLGYKPFPKRTITLAENKAKIRHLQSSSTTLLSSLSNNATEAKVVDSANGLPLPFTLSSEGEGDKREVEEDKPWVLLTCIGTGSIGFGSLTFIFTEGSVSLEVNPGTTSHKLYQDLSDLIERLHSIAYKGFLSETDTDLRNIPVIRDFLPFFLFKNLTKEHTVDEAATLVNQRIYIQGPKGQHVYKWILQTIWIQLYHTSLTHLFTLEATSQTSLDPFLFHQFEALTESLYASLDSSIRAKLTRRGLSVQQSIYTGFDTEYTNINSTTNSLVSVQLAVNTLTTCKIPLITNYKLSSINVSTQEVYSGMDVFPYFNTEKAEAVINHHIELIRELKFKDHDLEISYLVERLKALNLRLIENKDYLIVRLPRTTTHPLLFIDKGSGFTLNQLVKEVLKIGDAQLQSSYLNLMQLLALKELQNSIDSIEGPNVIDNLAPLTELEPLTESEQPFEVKSLTRTHSSLASGEPISITRRKSLYIIGHLIKADLCMLKDFNDFKDELNVVKNTFVTLGKGFKIQGVDVKIRDTILLAPGSSKGLKALGEIYGLNKLDLSHEEITDMKSLLIKDPVKFRDYGIRDAVIPLVHLQSLEDLAFSLNEEGVPITLASLSNKFVVNFWNEMDYKGYQLQPLRLIGDVSSSITPKGLIQAKLTGLKLPMFIAAYKGGRNESYAYGVDLNSEYYDYDIISAYTTILAVAGHPLYNQGHTLSSEEIMKLSDEDLIFSYLVMRVNFKFPDSVLFPSIPCFVDETTTVYPLEGEATITGVEYLLARNQGAQIIIHEAFRVPFAKSINKELIQAKIYEDLENGLNPDLRVTAIKALNSPNALIANPFLGVIEHIQEQRRKHNKGSFNNLIYKEIGNSIYGNIVRGISDKRYMDLKSGVSERISATYISNPLIASWITAFIRSLLGECLHTISLHDGKIISATTDGFITNLKNADLLFANNTLYKETEKIREKLSGNKQVIESKNKGKGIVSWTTRGQLSNLAGIKATTGFQKGKLSLKEMEEIFIQSFATKEKGFEFIHSTLRSAKSVWRKGGHVTMTYRDQLFRLHHDNRRQILIPINLKGVIDFSNTILWSKPLKDIETCERLRTFMKLARSSQYNPATSPKSNNQYSDYTQLAIRNFAKLMLTNRKAINMESDLLLNSQIVDFIKDFDPKAKISLQSLANLKKRNTLIKSAVPVTKETKKFVDFVKTKFPNFNQNNFWA